MITRDGKPVAEIRAPRGSTGRDLSEALRKAPPLDEDFAGDVARGLSMLTAAAPRPWT